MIKKHDFKLADAAETGAQHRLSDAHLGGRQVSLEEAIKAASKKKTGPPKAFDGMELRRINAFMPIERVRQISSEAALAGLTIGEYLVKRLFGE